MSELTIQTEAAVMSAINSIANSPENINLSFREKIEKVEEVMKTKEQIEIPVSHLFFDGMYIRQITIPKGSLLTSKYHKVGQFDVMLQGRMSILTNDGVMEIQAPYYGTSRSDLKRFGYAHEDTVWLDIRVIDEGRIEDIEKQLYADTYEELLEYKIESSQEDFNLLLEQYDITAETVREQSENEDDQTEIDLNYYNVRVDKSDIEGNGIWPEATFIPGDIIGPSRLGGLRTQLGRYTNHSNHPNAEMVMQGKDVFLVAIRLIQNVEITVDYRVSLILSGIVPVKED